MCWETASCALKRFFAHNELVIHFDVRKSGVFTHARSRAGEHRVFPLTQSTWYAIAALWWCANISKRPDSDRWK